MDKKYINKADIERIRDIYESYLKIRPNKPRQDYIVLPAGGKGTGGKNERTVYAG